MRARVCCAVWLAGAAAVAFGQVSKPGTGTVTGHVICQDTQAPARFAQVMLYAVPASLTSPGKPDPNDPKSLQAFIKAQADAVNSSSFVLTQTGFDGSFAVNDVAPGEYYVMASVAGYEQPQDMVQAANDAGEDVTKGIPGVPTVRVSADRAINIEINVIRGAAVEGRVLWDDGGPVTAAVVSVEPKTGEHKQLPPQFLVVRLNGQSNGNTDDRGHYRIAGLAPGEYTVRAMLQTNRKMVLQRGRMNANASFGTTPLIVYAPGGFRRTDAKPVTLAAGEEHVDEDITFNLSATHTVSGRVTSSEDHHGLNRGIVTLTDTTDKTFMRSAGLDADGNFTVTFVPSGTYTMAVANAADTVPEADDSKGLATFNEVKAARTYQKAEQQVIVAADDLTGENIELTPVSPGKNDGGDGN